MAYIKGKPGVGVRDMSGKVYCQPYNQTGSPVTRQDKFKVREEVSTTIGLRAENLRRVIIEDTWQLRVQQL